MVTPSRILRINLTSNGQLLRINRVLKLNGFLRIMKQILKNLVTFPVFSLTSASEHLAEFGWYLCRQMPLECMHQAGLEPTIPVLERHYPGICMEGMGEIAIYLRITGVETKFERSTSRIQIWSVTSRLPCSVRYLEHSV